MPVEESSLYKHASLQERTVGRFRPLERVPGIAHAVTTKAGGLFPKDADAGAEEYARLAGDLGAHEAAWVTQVHGGEILRVDDAGNAGEADGLVTTRPGLAVLVRGADCPLILAADRSGVVVGAAHASWRGTVARAAEHLIATMVGAGAEAGGIVACICPSAGPDSYEVGPEVRDAFLDEFGPDARHVFIRTNGSLHLDLWAANVIQLQRAGVGFMNLYDARIDTIRRTDLYPSHRAEGESAGRFVAMITRQA